jgi:hypothetical protein
VNIRFGSLADIEARPFDVRFTPKSGHRAPIRSIDVEASFGVRVLSKDVDGNLAAKSKSSLLLFGAVERKRRAPLQSTEIAELFLTEPVTFVHAFCNHSPSFRMKSPHRSATLDYGGASGLRSAAMSNHAFDFLQSWVVENVKATIYEDEDTAENLAHDCAWEAKTRGITEGDLIEAAGGDLNVYIRAELNRRFNREVDNRVTQDVY